jgi:ABC-type cobalamin/Fe3+-siderophores transport system ATPase subunit
MEVLITIKNYRCFSDSNPARITIRQGFTAFIGVNNSGKSTLLKFFYEFRNLFELLSDPNNFIKIVYRNPIWLRLQGVLDNQEIYCNDNNRPITINFQFLCDSENTEDNNLDSLKEINLVMDRNDNSVKGSVKIGNNQFSGIYSKSNITSEKILNIRNDVDNLIASADISKILETLKNLSITLYIGPFRNAINVLPLLDVGYMKALDGQYLNYFDIKVGRDFIRQWRQFKTGNDRNRSLTTLELTDDIKRIFNFEQLEINSSHDDQSLQLFINRKVYNLSELGSGLAQFILVLVNVAIQRPSYILIDEPELNLHPSLQLDFLTTLGRYATEGTLFATHSIGLARSSADHIYTVKKTPRGSEVKEYEKNPGLLELLGELSYSTYREFGFKKVLLVEGRTEIKTFQQFLRKYRQDQHILILSLGGKDFINEHSIEEMREIQRISDKIYVLIDSEKDSANVELEECRQKFKQNCEMSGIYCHILERRAIENYFTDRAIKSVKTDRYSALEPYQKLEDASLGWNKSENWRIAKEMTIEELESTDLGEFIRIICE